jgi:phospholipase/carboxylesterase
MNRLATQPATYGPSLAASKSPISLPLDDVSISGMRSEDRQCPLLRPAVFCPLHYERGYAYPLIVWLHGDGEDEHALRRLAPRISLRNYVAVAPRGTAPHSRTDADQGFAWSQDADHVELADERVMDAIHYVRRNLNIAPDRVFVGGQEEGGTMALRLAFENPRRFAGAISIDGLLPRQGLPLQRIKDLRSLPVFLSMRCREPRSTQLLEHDERLLFTAGVPYSLRMYANKESALPETLVDLDRWIMSVVCQSAQSLGYAD